MRLGAIGENLIERIVTRLNIAPMPLLETQIGKDVSATTRGAPR